MCFAVDKNYDRERTLKQIADRSVPKHGRNWLGHREQSQAAIIDNLLLDGASISEMAGILNVSKARVRNHLYHLQSEHGLMLVSDGEKKKFDLN